MYYYDILVDICSQIGDPSMDNYKERAKDHFIRAIFTLINSKEFSPEDIPGYYKLKTDVVFSTNPYDSSALKLLKIEKLFLNPAVAKDVTVTYKTINEIAKIANIVELQPTNEDLFIYKVGVNIYAFVNSVASNFTLASDTIYMAYIEDIDNSGWDDTPATGTNFQNTSAYLFSYKFVNQAIALAVQTLKQEDETKS